MAIEGTTEVIDGGAPASEGVTKPDATTDKQVGEKQTPVAGAPPEKTRDYDREIAGFKADLIKERKARQQFETDLKEAREIAAREQKRARLLATDNPQTEAEAEEDAVRQRFKQLYPHLADLTEDDVKAIRANQAMAGNLQQTTELFWQRHNDAVKDSLRENLEKEIGGKLSERQMARVVAEYVREVENNPEFIQRHERGDKTLAVEIAKQLAEDWFEPARRKVTQQESQRFRPVPSGKDRGIVTHGDKKIDVNDPKAVEDFLVKGFRERNGEFTGRR